MAAAGPSASALAAEDAILELFKRPGAEQASAHPAAASLRRRSSLLPPLHSARPTRPAALRRSRQGLSQETVDTDLPGLDIHDKATAGPPTQCRAAEPDRAPTRGGQPHPTEARTSPPQVSAINSLLAKRRLQMFKNGETLVYKEARRPCRNSTPPPPASPTPYPIYPRAAPQRTPLPSADWPRRCDRTRRSSSED